jgi:hypothetical protein
VLGYTPLCRGCFAFSWQWISWFATNKIIIIIIINLNLKVTDVSQLGSHVDTPCSLGCTFFFPNTISLLLLSLSIKSYELGKSCLMKGLNLMNNVLTKQLA